MQRWNRTVLRWDLRGYTEIRTTLPVLSLKGTIEKGKFQDLHGLCAVSLPGRRGKIEVSIHPSVNFFDHAGEKHILRRFTNLLGSDRGVTIYRGTWGEGAWPPLSIEFELKNDEDFCDTAIDLAKAILKKAGVKDKNNYFLGHFTLKEDTFVKFENGWISLVRWLRVQHQLPLDYFGDERNIPVLEGQGLI